MPSEFTDQKILITGATGFIGTHLTHRLLNESASITAVVRNAEKARGLFDDDVHIRSLDLRDIDEMEAIFESAEFDYVFHCAAWQTGGDRADAFPVNVTGTLSLALGAALSGAIRIIHLSTISVYGITDDVDIDEETPTPPYKDPYGDSKIAGEFFLKQIAEVNGLSYCVLRPGFVYGPGSVTWGTRILGKAKHGFLPLINGGRGYAAPIYIDDLIDLMLICAVHPGADGEVFNAVGNPDATMRDFFGGFMDMIPTRSALRLPGFTLRLAGALLEPFTKNRSYRHAADLMDRKARILNDKAIDVVGWEPKVPLEEGLERTKQWFVEEGLL